jgi:hypothetical protein
MHTETQCVAPITEPDSHDAGPDLVAQVHKNSRRVIEVELKRLSRRVPRLGPADMDVIAAALDDLSESLILRPLRTAPHAAAPLLWRLFSAAEDP